MTTTETAYIETFGCGPAGEHDFGHDHDPRTDCAYAYRCGTCGTEDLPCAEHAPREFPGLMMTDCYAEPKHAPSWVYANDAGYGAPCMWCSYEGERAAHDGCRHSGHRAWRRWKAVSRLVSAGYSLGVIRGSTQRTGGGCDGCVTFEWGRSSYLLGWDRWKWQALRHCLKRGHRPVGIDECSQASDGREMNFCVKCSPCPGCMTCQPADADGGCDGALLAGHVNFVATWDNASVRDWYDRCGQPATHEVKAACINGCAVTWEACAGCASLAEAQVAAGRGFGCITCQRERRPFVVDLTVTDLPAVPEAVTR